MYFPFLLPIIRLNIPKRVMELIPPKKDLDLRLDAENLELAEPRLAEDQPLMGQAEYD